MKEIREKLLALKDEKYAEFTRKLIPTMEAKKVIGVRTPEIRKLAKELVKRGKKDEFLKENPHEYLEENALEAAILSEEKDFETCIRNVESFLPFVDNWSTCDMLSPKIFKKHKEELLPYIEKWISSEETYTIRFGIGMLMQFYLDEDFKIEYVEKVAEVKSEEYYVNMMIAWYFATALAKRYEEVLPFLKEGRLSVWTHNKAIQKARESFRVSKERKEELWGMKR